MYRYMYIPSNHLNCYGGCMWFFMCKHINCVRCACTCIMYNVYVLYTHTHVPNTCMCYMYTCTCSSTHDMSVNKLNATNTSTCRCTHTRILYIVHTVYIHACKSFVPSGHKFHLCESFTLSLLYCRRKLNQSHRLPLPPLTSPVIVSGQVLLE